FFADFALLSRTGERGIMAPSQNHSEVDMSERIKQTQAMLAAHHRDGERFAEMMKQGFAERFNDDFWAEWDHWIKPVYSAQPRVLDLGAGPGMFLQALAKRAPGIHAIGVECAPYMLEAKVELPEGCEMITEDLHEPKLPLEDGSVDAAMASVVLHEMKQPLRTLQEMQRCLKPGGRLYILDWVRAPLEVYIHAQTEEARVFDRETPVDELDDLFIHFIEHNRFSREDLIYMLNMSGFSVLHSRIMKEGRYAQIVAEKR
ncbi:MAG: class I SAM-dependent methyltransferase, partial [Gammaproteobacteria bacterium]|nr:class I SAM-dependent methyltransferase [Gammaproteobacteria bacterium]